MLFFLEFIQKRMFYARLLILGKGVQLYVVNALENIVFYVGIFLFQLLNQRLYLSARGKSILVAARQIFGKFASTSDKFQTVIFFPAQNILFQNTIHRTNKLHTLEVGALDTRQHTLDLSAV